MAQHDKEPRQLDASGPTSGPPGYDFEELFARFYRPVNYFFANRGFSNEECRDLTQETFLGVYKGIERFRRSSSIETWLFTIAGNIWRNELRSRSAGKRVATEVSLAGLIDDGDRIADNVDNSVKPAAPGPLDETLADERARLLREAMDELPAQMRRCIQLRVNQDMKYREIAAVMQISIETVKSQLYQARDRLRKQLAENFTELEL